MAAAQGFLTVAILVVNNLRDIDNDRIVNKKTLAVRFGVKWTTHYNISFYYCRLPGARSLQSCCGNDLSLEPVNLGSIPLAIYWAVYITRYSGKALNKALAGTGQLELVYAVLFTLACFVCDC